MRTYESREVAEAAFADPALPEEIAEAAVDTASMQIRHLDEAGSGAH